MRIHFTEISPRGNTYILKEIASEQSIDECIILSPFRAECVITKVAEARVELKGSLEALLQLSCDRCLDEYTYQFNCDFHVILDSSINENLQIKDLECSAEDLDIVHVEEPLIDLDEFLVQQIILALPAVHICKDSCKGICTQCGGNRNEALCSCDETARQHLPFAALSSLYNKK